MNKRNRRRVALLCCSAVLFSGTLWAGPHIKVSIPQPVPCNIFDIAKPVEFAAALTPNFTGNGQAVVQITDYYGKTETKEGIPVQFKAGASTTVDIRLGILASGYYELIMTVSANTDSGANTSSKAKLSFGVSHKVVRTAKEVRDGGYRFGMKIWQLGKPGVWWRRPLVWRLDNVLQACEQLGLQWTRLSFSQQPSEEPGVLGVQEVLADYEMNVVMKVEGIPAEAYDAERYGPQEAFKKRFNGKPWQKATLPKEEPYKKWLRAELLKLPPEQNILEVWNEPWDWFKTMPGKDFANICTWVKEVTREVRPHAVVGPNCGLNDGSNHGTSPYSSYAEGVQAGHGFDTMDMIAIHPYTSSTPEKKNFRACLRNDHDQIRHLLGRDLTFYATEYGWSTAPKGKRCVSEKQQAQYTVRESLLLYAEDVKVLIPHTMGQREHNPADREHWFGFFRINMDPKPAIIAHAVSARMIDASRFVGDLWYGPGIGAMLFERGGVYTLVLWTEDKTKTLSLDVKAKRIAKVDLMGRSTSLTTTNGKTTLDINGDVTYLVGVGRELEALVSKPGTKLRYTRWGRPRAANTNVSKLTSPIVVDGYLDDWGDTPTMSKKAPKLDDLAATWRFGWDKTNLYMAVTVTDKAIINSNEIERIFLADVVNFAICSRPERQVAERVGIYEYEMQIAPTSATGAPALLFKNPLLKKIVSPDKDHKSGIKWAVTKTDKNWTVEVALPFSILAGAEAKAGTVLPYNLVIFDRDRTDINEWKQWWKRLEIFNKKAPAPERPLLILQE